MIQRTQVTVPTYPRMRKPPPNEPTSSQMRRPNPRMRQPTSPNAPTYLNECVNIHPECAKLPRMRQPTSECANLPPNAPTYPTQYANLPYRMRQPTPPNASTYPEWANLPHRMRQPTPPNAPTYPTECANLSDRMGQRTHIVTFIYQEL